MHSCVSASVRDYALCVLCVCTLPLSVLSLSFSLPLASVSPLSPLLLSFALSLSLSLFLSLPPPSLSLLLSANKFHVIWPLFLLYWRCDYQQLTALHQGLFKQKDQTAARKRQSSAVSAKLNARCWFLRLVEQFFILCVYVFVSACEWNSGFYVCVCDRDSSSVLIFFSLSELSIAWQNVKNYGSWPRRVYFRRASTPILPRTRLWKGTGSEKHADTLGK